MFKKLLVLAFAILFIVGMAGKAEALYGLSKFWAAVYDSEGNVKTDLSSVTVYTADSTTEATIYSDSSGTSLTNPITTGLSDGVFEFYGSATSYDIDISDGVRVKRISGMTTTSPHRVLLIQQLGKRKVIRFLPTDFLIFDYIGWKDYSGGVYALSKPEISVGHTEPALRIENKLPCLVWRDGQVCYVQVTFKVPTDYKSGAGFKAFVDYHTGSDNPEIDYFVLVNSDGTTWDTAYTIQTAVDPAGTAGTPELVDLPISTDFASLAADNIITFAIGRDDEESSAADLELYYVEFYYDAKE